MPAIRSSAMTDFRNFRGAARPLDDLDLPRIGYRIRVGEDDSLWARDVVETDEAARCL